jgi:hypothetical protein
MRKTVVLLLMVGLIFVASAPAPAADRTLEERVKVLEDTLGTWSFYGSARYATFFEKSSSDAAFKDTDNVTNLIGGSPSLTGPDQKLTQWGLAANTRLGAQVNKGDFGGKVEFKLKDDGSVGVRLMYGTYKVNDITFVFGQDYGPLSDFPTFSNQVFNGDDGLKGWGVIDENPSSRIPQIKIRWNGLQVALLETGSKYATGLNLPADAKATTEALLPHLEARYTFKADRFTGDIFGGASTYKVKSESLDIDKSVNSYAAGLCGGVKAAPVYGNAMVWMARNGKQLGLHQADAAGANFNLDDEGIINDKDYGYALTAGVVMLKVTVEAGYGFVSSKPDVDNAINNKAQSYYLNATIPVVQTASAKFFVVPEVGIFDYMKDANGDNQGKATYAGAKWQVDF